MRAQHEKDALDIIKAAARGGQKKTRLQLSITNKGTEIHKTVETVLPNWHAAAWYLERCRKPDYLKHVEENPHTDKTPEEIAQDIHKATKAMFDSVPLQ